MNRLGSHGVRQPGEKGEDAAGEGGEEGPRYYEPGGMRGIGLTVMG